MPLLFGAVHPIVQGLYTALILVGCGGWLLLNADNIPAGVIRSRLNLVFLIFLAWLLFTAIPLPMGVVELLSPARAASLAAVNQLAGTEIRSAALGYNPMAALRSMIFLFALLLYGLCLRVMLQHDSSFLRQLLYTCIGLGVFEAAYGMMQVLNPHIGILWLSATSHYEGMAKGTIIYKNQYASLLNMCWPMAVGAALLLFKNSSPAAKKKHHKLRRSIIEQLKTRNIQGALLLFLAAFIMMAVLFSQSRGGTIAMALVLVLLLVLLPMERGNRLRLALALAGLIAVYGSAIGFSSIVERFLDIGESGTNRLNIYLSSLPMLGDHLLTGIGLESYRLLSPVYLKNFPEKILFDRAHNEYLELTIELGLPVAACFFAALFTAMVLWARRLRAVGRQAFDRLRSAPLVALVCYCAMIGFLVHGVADFGWRLPANLVYAVILIALIGNGTAPGRNSMPVEAGSGT
jgi:O-antigen ligase